MALTRRVLPAALSDWKPGGRDERLDLPLAELKLSVRTVNFLEAAGLFSVGQLLACCAQHPEACDCGRRHVLAISNLGETTLDEIFRGLAGIGFERGQRLETGG